MHGEQLPKCHAFYWHPYCYVLFGAEESKVQSLARSRAGIQAQVFGFKGQLCFFLLSTHDTIAQYLPLTPKQNVAFPAGPVVKISPSSAKGEDSVPDKGLKIPRASRPEYQNIRQKQYCSKVSVELLFSWAPQVLLVVKNPAANAATVRDQGSIPGSERSPAEGNGNPLQRSCLENPMGRGAWRATDHGVAKGQTRLKRLSMHAESYQGN